MKVITIFPVELGETVRIIIETEVDKEGVESVDALVCMKDELIEQIKKTLVNVGVLNLEE